MNAEELNALKNRVHGIAVEHGFYEDVKPDAFYLGLIMSAMGRTISADQKGWHADMESFEELLANEHPFSNAFFYPSRTPWRMRLQILSSDCWTLLE